MTTKEKIEDYILDKNFLSAYMVLQKVEKDSSERIELTGFLIQTILGELNRLEGKGSKENHAYLRSLLIELMREVPGLAPIFKEQLRRTEQKSLSHFDLAEKLRDFIELSQDTKAVSGDFHEKLQGLGDEIDSMLKDSGHNASVKDFFSKTENSLKDSMKQATDLFESFTETLSSEFKQREKQKDQEAEKETEEASVQKNTVSEEPEDSTVEDAEFEIDENN